MLIRARLLFLLLFFFTQLTAQKKEQKNTAIAPAPARVWSAEKANAWYKQQGWITGANYIPNSAINQLEMWQADTYDSAGIDRELGWAQNIGFNTMRVFLHSIAWKQDPEGFKKRVENYLGIADRHRIKTILVFFDDCWNKVPQAGTQPKPKPGIHNSGWVQDPGDPFSEDTSGFAALEKYVKDVMMRFRTDKRILMWDLYNEPGNSGKKDSSLPLLKNVFEWARAVNADQPLTVGLWAWDFENLNAFQLANSDIITYHNYEEPQWHLRVIQLLKTNGKPLICTEYMARTRNSRFSNTLPLLKNQQVGAINWGFVAGKSNTIYAWDTPVANGGQPDEWFHDIFMPDGAPYRSDEVNLIKRLNGIK
ncbi:MAG: glycoside hydrolase family 2 TIM barrel-domain containing protein [Chitinophagaceae bacterium]